jgi:hypothetical protein
MLLEKDVFESVKTHYFPLNVADLLLKIKKTFVGVTACSVFLFHEQTPVPFNFLKKPEK